MLDLWYANAVVYCVDVETFRDGNDDGVGDFVGLAASLGHLERLGVNCLWLNPFYPTPNRDNGYDITDFYSVDPRHGTLGDFVAFMHAAQDRGMRVIVDLVVNHTSIDHPWFAASRASKDSPYRDWYVWRDEEPENKAEGIIFPGEQDAVWTRDEATGSWYLHRFYAHQADLNVANPAVREEIQRIMGFWLQLGVSGFRVDAVPFLIEYKGLTDIPDGRENPYLLLDDMHAFMEWRRAEAILLAEANVEYDKAPEFFSDGNRMQLVFDFIGNQAAWLAFARDEAAPLADALRRRPAPGGEGQWATFLRNHDELSLDKLDDPVRHEVYDAFGPSDGMQVYGRGLRRRLAPMLDGDPNRLRLAFSLLFALPGTPVLWYGDEIGLGENLDLEMRNAVRCPMQWTNEPGAGFSKADPEAFVRALATGQGFGPDAVNAADQWADPDSLLNTVRALVTLRRAAPEIGRGRTRVLGPNAGSTDRSRTGKDSAGKNDAEADNAGADNDDDADTAQGTSGPLVLEASWRGKRTVTVHNLSCDETRWTIANVEGPLYRHLASTGVDTGDAGRELPMGAELVLPGRGWLWLRSIA